MSTQDREFSFGDDSIAKAYDTILVPALFDPWAKQLIDDFSPWEGLNVLDLASGTGIISDHLCTEVGKRGSILAVDINLQMLEIAKQRCSNAQTTVKFIESSADELNIQENSIDVVICQQGFQFFPDKIKAAKELMRVLVPGGKVICTTWKPVDECQLFGAICDSLEKIGEQEISNMMRVPFDHLSKEELQMSYEMAGFVGITVSEKKMDLINKDWKKQPIDFAFATPIGPKLNSLSNEKRNQFEKYFLENIKIISRDVNHLGYMKSNQLTAIKPN